MEQAPDAGAQAPAGEDVINAVGSGLQQLAQTPELPDEVKQGFAALLEQYGQLVAALQGGGAPEPSQPAPAVAGGNPNARPMGPQG